MMSLELTFEVYKYDAMKRTVYFIVAALSAVLGIILIGNVLVIGEKIGAAAHPYLEYAFYMVTLLLLFYFIVVPVARLLLMPEFPELRTEDGWDLRKMKKFAGSLAVNCFYISDAADRKEHRKRIEEAVSAAGEDIEAVKAVIAGEIDARVSNINKLISGCGRKVFVLTAASQNSTLDTFSVIILNIRLIYQIVCATGYRPNIFQLGRIMIGVLGSAFTAYISQSLTNSLEGGLKNVFANAGFPIIGPILGMLLNGSLNAALTLYVGYTTRNYVLKGRDALDNEKDKAGVMSSAVSMASEFIREKLSAKKDAVVSTTGALTEKISGIGKSFVERITSWLHHRQTGPQKSLPE